LKALHCATLPCTRAEADAAAAADAPFERFDPQPSLVASEIADGWQLQMWTEGAPSADLLSAFSALAPSAGCLPVVEAVEVVDWVTLSQQGLAPVNVGRVHLHTADRAGEALSGQFAIRIDAGLAFGTGQHATTSGVIAATLALGRRCRVSHALDVGTGSGVLAFVAQRLWRRARIVAADIDSVAVRVATGNARLNGVSLGRGPGRLDLLVAPGVAHRRIAEQAPYPLVLANILAGPLVALAPALSAMVARGGHLVLAGLLQSQSREVIAAYRRHGFALVARNPRSEWPVLVLRRARPSGRAAAIRAARRGRAASASKAVTI